MYKIFAVLAVLLILSGVLLLAVPKEQPSAGPRSLAPTAQPAPTFLTTARGLAEQANAPLSIIFGLASLYYTRRTYINSKRLSDGKPQA